MVTFLRICIETFFERTRPASSMVKPAAIQNTRTPPNSIRKLLRMYLVWVLASIIASANSGVAGAVSWAKAGNASAAPSASAQRTVRPAEERLAIVMSAISMEERGRSQRVGVCFAGADAHGLVDAVDEDLSVADLAGPRSSGDRIDR